MKEAKALLALADGSLFHGKSIGAEDSVVGEVVFNTAITGYQEILTDPSYREQIVTLTHPHIGNTGMNEDDEESRVMHVKGLVVRDAPASAVPSNFRSTATLRERLRDQGVVAISDVDTRRLTRLLRDKGALSGCLMAGPEIDAAYALKEAKEYSGLIGRDLAADVGVGEFHQWPGEVRRFGEPASRAPDNGLHVVVCDFGVKRNILSLLSNLGCRVTLAPAKSSPRDILNCEPDGVLLSNGPGDPAASGYAIETARELLQTGLPLFGICLGHQLLGLACGAQTHKMKFGHHGANHPIQCLADGSVMITSQNHGFALSDAGLPEELEITHRSLFDGSIQGIRHRQFPAASFQGHPEASPGPREGEKFFADFVQSMADRRAQAN